MANWTDVIEVELRHDREQGSYLFTAYNALEQQLLQRKAWSGFNRGAQLEVTDLLNREHGYVPVHRWISEGEVMRRKFRRES